MISGTSKCLSKSGPIDLLIITDMSNKIQENLWNQPGEILCMSILDPTNRFFREMYVLGTICFRVLVPICFSIVVCGNLITYY